MRASRQQLDPPAAVPQTGGLRIGPFDLSAWETQRRNAVEVPELRGTRLVRWRVSLGQRSRVPLYALVVALLARRRSVAAASGVWWLLSAATELRHLPGPRSARIAALPVVLARDGITAVSLVAGSVRAR